MTRALFLLCYDVSSPRRANRLRRRLRAFAFPLQKSVYECRLSPAERDRLVQDLSALIDPREDSCVLMHVDPRGWRWRHGAPPSGADDDLIYFGLDLHEHALLAPPVE